MLTPALRKFALTAHVTASVGWLGAVACFLVLAVVGVRSEDGVTVRAAYVSSDAITWFAIVPFAVASLLTGLVVSLGTPWGLFRHYWVVVKLTLTILATLLLLLHTRPIGFLARAAREMTFSGPEIGRLQIQLVADAVAAVVALLINVTLSVYKPRGVTAYGRRRLAHDLGAESDSKPARTEAVGWVKLLTVVVFALLVLFVVLHISGHGLGSLHH